MEHKKNAFSNYKHLRVAELQKYVKELMLQLLFVWIVLLVLTQLKRLFFKPSNQYSWCGHTWILNIKWVWSRQSGCSIVVEYKTLPQLHLYYFAWVKQMDTDSFICVTWSNVRFNRWTNDHWNINSLFNHHKNCSQLLLLCVVPIPLSNYREKSNCRDLKCALLPHN